MFYRTGMYPILIADDALSWFESGAVQDLTIRNNTFEDCGYNSGSGAIMIAPENRELIPGKSVHRNIRIINNTFKLGNNAVLTARSVENIVFAGNKINHTHFMEKDSTLAAIELTACKKVLIEGNSFAFPEIPVINAIKMTKTDFKTDMNIHFKQ